MSGCDPGCGPAQPGPAGPRGPAGPQGPPGPAAPAGQGVCGASQSTSVDAVIHPNFPIMYVDTTGGPVTIALPPAPAQDSCVSIKDAGGSAATFNIIVDGNGNTIDGQALYIMGINYQASDFHFNGDEWSIF
jgi:hypothetical protein